MSGIGRPGIGQLPPHDHHQGEAEEQEQEAGDGVLDADHLVIDREDVFPPEPELLVMRLVVSMSMSDAQRSLRCPFLSLAGRPRSFVSSGEIVCRRHKRAQVTGAPCGARLEPALGRAAGPTNVRYRYDPGRPRRRRARHGRAGRPAGDGQPRIGSAPRQSGQRHLQPRPRPGARDVPPGGRRRPRRCGGVSRARERAVAQHHVSPRQHDGRRLPGPRQPDERAAPAAASGNRGRLSRRARSGARARPQARRSQPPRRRRPLSDRRRRRLAGLASPPSKAEPSERSAPRGRLTKSTKRCWLWIRAARMPDSPSERIATSCRCSRCRCAGSRTWRDSAEEKTAAFAWWRKRQRIRETTRPTRVLRSS